MSPLPWLHIAEAVSADAARSGIRRVGLLGTRTVMEGTIYQPLLEQHGIDTVLPQSYEKAQLDRIIRTELIHGDYRLRSRALVVDIISAMAEQGAEAVILGCTELPLLLKDEDPVLRLLDSTHILAVAALQHAASMPLQDDLTPAVFSHN